MLRRRQEADGQEGHGEEGHEEVGGNSERRQEDNVLVAPFLSVTPGYFFPSIASRFALNSLPGFHAGHVGSAAARAAIA
jgi:hypothetical protein